MQLSDPIASALRRTNDEASDWWKARRRARWERLGRRFRTSRRLRINPRASRPHFEGKYVAVAAQDDLIGHVRFRQTDSEYRSQAHRLSRFTSEPNSNAAESMLNYGFNRTARPRGPGGSLVPRS